MICGTLLSKTINPYKSANGEMYGSVVAENELIRATLDGIDGISWDFWRNGLSPSLSETVEDKQSAVSLANLKRQYGARIRARSISSLPSVTANNPYIFVANVPGFSRLSEVRDSFECNRIPICCLVHSVLTTDILATYSWLAVNAREFDTLVATSSAGHIALDNIFAAALDRVSHKFGRYLPLPKPPRIVDIPFGVSVPIEEVLDREAARRILNVPSDAFVVLYLGRISEEYKADLDPLLQAMACLIQEDKKIVLVLAGQAMDRTYKAHLQRRLHALHLDDRTVCFYNFPEILKSTIYAVCDVFVSPTDSIQETFGLSILEAMAHARPVIASSWSGYRDIIIDGTTGFLINTRLSRETLRVASAVSSIARPREVAHYIAQGTFVDVEQLIDKLQYLLVNPAAALEMGSAARNAVINRYAWPKIVEEFQCLWTEQLALAKVSVQVPREKSGPQRYFEHYADMVLGPDDLVVGAFSLNDSEKLLKQWRFRSPTTIVMIRNVLAFLENYPATANDLYTQGYDVEIISWLLKKGLLRSLGKNI